MSAEPLVEANVPLCPQGLHPMTPENTYTWEGGGGGRPRTIRRCRACRRDAHKRSQEKKEGLEEARGREHDDLTVAILQVLPDCGAKLGKYLDDVKTAAQLAKILDDPYITSAVLGRRLAALQKQDLVAAPRRSTFTNKRSMGWQRTSKGREIAEAGE